jgi:hypothetical protein
MSQNQLPAQTLTTLLDEFVDALYQLLDAAGAEATVDAVDEATSKLLNLDSKIQCTASQCTAQLAVYDRVEEARADVKALDEVIS